MSEEIDNKSEIPEVFPSAHRDDLPSPVAEAITDYFKEQFPGVEVFFIGDRSDLVLSKENQEQLTEQEEKILYSMANGVCLDCHTQITEIWPPPDDAFQVPDDWDYYKCGDVGFFVCPECKKKEEVIYLDLKK